MKQQDFTTGNLFKQIFLFSTPIMLANLLQASYQFVDSLWVGNLLGADALGSVAISTTIIFTMLSFIIGINNTTLTILSQQKGKGKKEGLRRYLNAFVVTLTAVGAVLGLLVFMTAELFISWIGTPPSMVSGATAYLKINAFGILFLLGYNFIGTVLRALGDSRTPLRYVLIAVCFNIVLDPLFIAGFKMGVEGAAYATVCAQGLSFLYGIYDILKRKAVPFARPSIPQFADVRLILHLGIPSGLQMAFISAGIAAIMSVVTSHGDTVVAGFSAAQRLDSLIILPAQALSTAVNSMAGQNIGANQWNRVRQITRYGLLYNFIIMTILALLIILLAKPAIKLFLQEDAAISFGASYLKWIALFYPFLGINFILNGVVRASGAMYQVLVLNILSFWVLRYPLTALFSVLFNEKGIALGMGTSFIVSSIIAVLYYHYGKWRKKELFSEANE